MKGILGNVLGSKSGGRPNLQAPSSFHEPSQVRAETASSPRPSPPVEEREKARAVHGRNAGSSNVEALHEPAREAPNPKPQIPKKLQKPNSKRPPLPRPSPPVEEREKTTVHGHSAGPSNVEALHEPFAVRAMLRLVSDTAAVRGRAGSWSQRMCKAERSFP